MSKSFDCRTYIKKICRGQLRAEFHVWIYRRPSVLARIKNAPCYAGRSNEEEFHRDNGRLFGYGAQEIEEFIRHTKVAYPELYSND
jgi:hypothetical protein